MKTCIAVGAGAIAGTGAGVTAYVAGQVVDSTANYDDFSKKLPEKANEETNKEFLESFKTFNEKVKSDDIDAQNTAIAVGLGAAALAATATATLLPGDRVLDQGGGERGYVAGRQQRDDHPPNPNPPNTNPRDPHTDQERGITLER